MNTQLFDRFSPVIQSLSDSELDGHASLFDKLTLARDGRLQVCYAPFEFINHDAKVVIVGITPGKTQMINAIREARRQLDRGAAAEAALRSAKQVGAFSGSMRPNLVAMLDFVGIHRWLGIRTCDELFSTASGLVQTTSVLRNPVFVEGADYNGTPPMTRTPFLREQLRTHFGEDARALSGAVFIPLGDKVTEGLHSLAADGLLNRGQILDGMPHPSGANAERIAYFVGKKPRSALSAKTNPDKIDRARDLLLARASDLG